MIELAPDLVGVRRFIPPPMIAQLLSAVIFEIDRE
jgi:hypothetical protein